MIRIGIDGVTKREWTKSKRQDILHIQTEDGHEYEIVLTPVDKSKKTEEGNVA